MEEVAAGLRERLQGILARCHGVLRLPKSEQSMVAEVVAFQQRTGLTSGPCAALLGIKTTQLDYVRQRYREQTGERLV